VPAFDPASFLTTANFVRDEVARICNGEVSDVTAVHDVASGGIAGALGDMVAATQLGASVSGIESAAELFYEYPGRFVVASSSPADFLARCDGAGVAAVSLGVVGGERLVIDQYVDLGVRQLREHAEQFLEDQLRQS